MTNGGRRLGDIEPRERAGARTGRRYEYQYERTARAALDLLSDTVKHTCVYCDWHDDYVAESGDSPTRYTFNQVKARASSQGPWSFADLFGVAMKTGGRPSKNPPKIADGAILPLMLLHEKNFADSCAGIAFVTNTGIAPPLAGFLADVQKAGILGALSPPARSAFDHMARAYLSGPDPCAPSADALFGRLQRLEVYIDQGKLDDETAALLELGDIVEQFSEIQLLQSESKQIARQIVSRVRSKVGYTATKVPAAEQDLREQKGIVVGDLLSVLSLSTDGYKALRRGDSKDVVKTLSRLQRYCRSNGLDNVVAEICRFKAEWDMWRTSERHFISSVDYVSLVQEAEQIVRGGYDLKRMTSEARAMATRFSRLTSTPLTAEPVLGLMFSLAAQSQSSAQSLTAMGPVT